MASRMRKAIAAGALGVAVLVPSGTAFAQNHPPRDPNPPGYDDRGSWHHGNGDDRGSWHHGNGDDRGGWHHGW